MAQVTMSNQEYNALQHKADLFDTLFRQLVSNYKVSFDEDGSWRPVRIENTPAFDTELEQRIVTVIADQLAANEDAMDWLVREEEYIFDVPQSNTSNPRWENRLYKGQYDMRELSKAFKAAWQEAEKRVKVETEDEKTEEEEA
jgi:hypothetical protein